MNRICICGGGSVGHVCAGVLSYRDDVVLNLYSGHPERWGSNITVTDPDGMQYISRIARVSGDPTEVVAGQDIILLCLPGFLIERTLREIEPYIGDAVVGTVVSSTGFFFFAHEILGPDAKIFGFQRVPYISRVVEYGVSANLLGYRPSLSVVLENIPDRELFSSMLSELFMTPVRLLDSFYDVCLSNSNPIIHTGRLFTMFRGKENSVFDHRILFYREWTDEASQKLIEMDAELFKVLEILNVKSVVPLLDYYESTDAASLTGKISSIPAFQTIASPMVEVPGGWKPDFTSRYFIEDFPFGLRWIKESARKCGVATPVIDEVYEWGMGLI